VLLFSARELGAASALEAVRSSAEATIASHVILARYPLVPVSSSALGIISGYTRLLPDKEAPDNH